MTIKNHDLYETILYAVKVACELHGHDPEKYVIKVILADVEKQRIHPMTLFGELVPMDMRKEIELRMLDCHMDATKKLYPDDVIVQAIEADNETKH